MGTVLMAVSIVFIIMRFISYDIDFTDFIFSPLVGVGLLLTAIAIGCGILFAAYNFRWLLSSLSGLPLDSRLERRLVIKTYCTANLYKYLPGSIMYVVGRNRMALEIKELTHARVLSATVLEGASIAVAAVIVSGLFSFDYLAYFAGQARTWLWIGSIVLVVIILFLAIFFRFKLVGTLRVFAEGVKGVKIKAVARLLCVGLMIMLVLGGSFAALLTILGQTLSWHQIPMIIGVYVLSWLVGFMTPGAPGGLGVREAVMIMILGNVINIIGDGNIIENGLNEGIILSVAVIHRVLTMLGDVFAYFAVFVYGAAKGHLDYLD